VVAVFLGAGLNIMTLDPSIFHGYMDSLQPYIDGVKSMGTELVAGEQCDIIEVSFMKRQRSKYFWLSRSDNLPRKLKEVVRISRETTIHEIWSNFTLNGEISDDKFVWHPPPEWRQWLPPDSGEGLLRPGQEAPDFELLSSDEGTIKLSDYYGKVIWFYGWGAGIPQCRQEIPQLQSLYVKFRDKGLVILGFNYTDDKQIALDFLRENSVEFPTVIDYTLGAVSTNIDYKGNSMPLNYIIDREGKIVDGWYGYQEGHKRALEALEKLGIK
jgi:peroxiredoxin